MFFKKTRQWKTMNVIWKPGCVSWLLTIRANESQITQSDEFLTKNRILFFKTKTMWSKTGTHYWTARPAADQWQKMTVSLRKTLARNFSITLNPEELRKGLDFSMSRTPNMILLQMYSNIITMFRVCSSNPLLINI